MSTPLTDIFSFMEEIAPASGALHWDNVGLQIGNPAGSADTVLLALDISPGVVEEAKEIGAQLILTHHPFIFRPFSSINFNTVEGTLVRNLIQSDITLFSAHTNLDRSNEGTGVTLAKLLELQDIKHYTDEPADELNLAITGRYDEPKSFNEISDLFCRHSGCNHLRIIGHPDRISSVVVIPGSGGSLINKIRKPFDLIFTGELTYHDALSALYQGKSIAVAGHYFSEKPVMHHLKKLMEEKFPGLNLKVSSRDGEPFRMMWLERQ
ncbi:MAG: Nif3-like dinuclear metal center hexameric protein [Firmicutes bacterium]|nr:Nif3-like dinuclear metal center hexameric protein [Bacillota bacterium]